MKSHQRQIFIISDTHFGDEKLYTKYSERYEGFENTIVDSWNKKVPESAIVYVLGDIIWKSKYNNIFEELNGTKILIKGNHDGRTYSWYYNHGFSFVCESTIIEYMGLKILLTHKPDYLMLHLVDYNVHGHLHERGYCEYGYKETPKHLCYRMMENGCGPVSLYQFLKTKGIVR